MPTNPFKHGRPIVHPAHFIGRQNELTRIRDACYQLRSTSIVGERRAGKSSLLKYFTLPQVTQKLDFDPQEYIFCFTDLEGLEDIEPHQFWELVLEELAQQLPKDSPGREKILRFIEAQNFDNIPSRRLFAQLDQFKIIFLFDEFETILSSSNFRKSFYGHLRYLTQNCTVAFVTATGQALVYHCLDDDTKTSPFFNIFDNLVIKPFTESECNKLVNVYLVDSDISFTASEIAKLIHLSGGYAAFFQFACAFLFYAYQDDLLREDEAKRLSDVEDKFRLQAKPHFVYFWDKSDQEEQIVLALTALLETPKSASIPEKKIKKLYPRYKNDLLLLENKSLILRSDEGFRLFSPLFSEWIVTELADISQKGDLSLDEWLAVHEKTLLQKGLDSLGNISDGLTKVNPKYWNLFWTILQHAPMPQQISDLLTNLGIL